MTRRARQHQWIVKRQQAKRYVKRHDAELYSWIVNRYYKKGCQRWRTRERIGTSYEHMEWEMDHLIAQQVADKIWQWRPEKSPLAVERQKHYIFQMTRI